MIGALGKTGSAPVGMTRFSRPGVVIASRIRGKSATYPVSGKSVGTNATEIVGGPAVVGDLAENANGVPVGSVRPVGSMRIERLIPGIPAAMTSRRFGGFSHQPGIGFLKLSASRILVLGVSGRKRFALPL